MVNKPMHEQEAKVRLSKEELKAQELIEAKRKRRVERVKIILAILFLVGGIAGYYVVPDRFGKINGLVLALIPIIGTVVALFIVFFWCDSGRRLSGYVRDSITEVKKVVWPERTDAIKQTLFVIAFVMVLALFIWVVDSAVTWLFYDLILGRG